MKHGKQGFGLVEVMIAAAVMVVIAAASMSMFRSQSQMSQSISAHGGITDLSNAVNLALSGVSCATNGAYLNAGSAAVVSVSTGYSLSLDTINFPDGSVAVTSLPNSPTSAMIRPYLVSPFVLRAVGGQGPNGATGFAFPFQLTVSFTSPGAGNGPPPPPLVKSMTIFTDSSYKVVGACFGGPNAAVPTGAVMAFNAATCPSGWAPVTQAQGRYIVGLNPGGTLGGMPPGSQALTNLEARMVPIHTHTVSGDFWVNDQSSVMQVSNVNAYRMSNRSQVDNAGDYTASWLAAPYVQFLYCQKM